MASYFRRKKFTSLDTSKASEIDYKNLRILKEYVTESGRMVPRRITGVAAGEQRRLTREIKRARFLALLEYCDTHAA